MLSLSKDDLIRLRSNYNQELLSIKERKEKHLTLEEIYILESLEESNNDNC